MNVFHRPLAGLVVGVSISEGDDSTSRGFPPWQVNRVTLQVVSALFGQGVGVIFGHDWREDGVMEAVHGFARQMQPPDPLSPAEAKEAGQPRLRNLIPWPDSPHLSHDDLERIASTLRVEEAGLPPELLSFDKEARAARDSALFGYLRARGLTHLRHRLDDNCDARVCLGGRRGGSQGRYPGVIEEALLSLQGGHPLYLAGILGGATSQVIDAIKGEPLPENFCPLTKATELYLKPPLDILEQDPETKLDREVNPLRVWTTFGKAGLEALSSRNGLSNDENFELFHTPVLDRVVQLMLTGLSRLKAKSR